MRGRKSYDDRDFSAEAARLHINDSSGGRHQQMAHAQIRGGERFTMMYMKINADFPSFDIELKELNQVILTLVDEYKAGKIKSWDELDNRVKVFYSPEKMDAIEAKASGWKKMASYSDGITLTHVMCVYLGLYIMPEFHVLTPQQKQMAKWIVLFHDIDKIYIQGKRDHTHAFRSGVVAAKALYSIGFPVTENFNDTVHSWSEFTKSAVIDHPNLKEEQISDNNKLPIIIDGIEKMYGKDTPAALIIKGVFFHMCVQVVKDWTQPSPLTDDELKMYINHELLVLLRVMHLADNDGWTLFEPDRESYISETLKSFERIEGLIP